MTDLGVTVMAADTGDEPRVPIVCEECQTTSRVSLTEVADAITTHNDRLHDGADIARVDPAIREAIADLAAADLGIHEEPADDF